MTKEELEKENAELTEQNTSLLTSVENLNKSVQELEKENAELKRKLEKSIYLMKELMINNETPAYGYTVSEVNKFKREVEQFLSEVENV